MPEPLVCCVKKYRSHPRVDPAPGMVHCYDCGLDKCEDQFQIGRHGKPVSPCIPCRAIRSRRYSTGRGYHPEFKERVAAWAKKNLIKRRAHQRVLYAVKTGRLEKRPCESCGNPKSQGHHEDYSKPLEVRWLCAVCHKKEHRKYA